MTVPGSDLPFHDKTNEIESDGKVVEVDRSIQIPEDGTFGKREDPLTGRHCRESWIDSGRDAEIKAAVSNGIFIGRFREKLGDVAVYSRWAFQDQRDSLDMFDLSNASIARYDTVWPTGAITVRLAVGLDLSYSGRPMFAAIELHRPVRGPNGW